MTDRAPSNVQELIDMFDAISRRRVTVHILESEEPDAPTALALWASARGATAVRTGGEESPQLCVTTPGNHAIVIVMRAFARAA